MLKIGEAEVYPDQNVIRRGGTETTLTPRGMDVLTYLAARPGDTISAEELLQALWVNEFIADNAVHKAVSEVRQALGDDHQNPRYILTVRKRGYRLIAPVSGAPTSGSPGRGRRRWLAPAASLAVVAVAAVAFVAWPTGELVAPAPPSNVALPNSVAVLPLANLMNDPEQDFFVEGMHDALITNLARIGALHVVSRTSVMGYAETDKSIPEIGADLGVAGLIEGSVFRSGNRVRIAVQLIDVATDRHLWAETYERELRDVLSLQRDVAQAIAREIRVRATPAEQAQLADERPVDPDAYEAFLKGVYHAGIYTRGGADLASLRRSIAYHEDAVRRDPGWALAHAGLAGAYHWMAGEGYPDDAAVLWQRSKASALKALELDPGLAAAHASLGYVLHNFEWDWEGARRAYERAAELDPFRSFGYAQFLLSAAQYDSAIAMFKRSEARNPNSLIMMTWLGAAHACAGRPDEAVKQLEKVIELEPEFAFGHLNLGFAYLRDSRYDEAVAAMEIAARHGGDRQLLTVLLPNLGYAYAQAGRTAEAQTILRELEDAGHGFFPELYVALDQRDRALTQYAAALDRRDRRLLYLQCSLAYDTLRDDARFQELLRRIGFPS